MRMGSVIRTCRCMDMSSDQDAKCVRVTESAVNVESRIIILTASRIPWKHTFDSWTLDFGESNEQLHPRQHAELRPRQAAASSSAASSAAATTSIDYPAAPSSTATSLNVTGNVDHSYIDTMILPPDQSLGQLSVSGPKM